MTKPIRSFRLATAIRSWFAMPQKPVEIAMPPEAPVTPAPQPSLPAQRKRLWALVQTRPAALVLLVSDCREDLEAEARELNDTWNHRELRTERHAYEIQPVALLQTGRDWALRDAGNAGRHPVG